MTKRTMYYEGVEYDASHLPDAPNRCTTCEGTGQVQPDGGGCDDCNGTGQCNPAPLAATTAPSGEPFGYVTKTRTGVQHFYPDSPYLDNAVECVTVYRLAPAQPNPSVAGEPVAPAKVTGRTAAWSQLPNALARHTLQELLEIYDECAGDWCRIARCVEEGVLEKSAMLSAPAVAEPVAGEPATALQTAILAIADKHVAMQRTIFAADANERLAEISRTVYLVATGETHEGLETYTRHENFPPPLCDAERLYTTPQPAPAAVSDKWATLLLEAADDLDGHQSDYDYVHRIGLADDLRALATPQPAPQAEPVAWWRWSYIDEQGNADADVQIGANMPTANVLPDNGFPWQPLYGKPLDALATPQPAPAAVSDETPSEKQRKLMELADRIDYERLCLRPGMTHRDMTPEQRDRMNAGVELRRYAQIWKADRWIVIPPVGPVRFSASTLDKAYEMAKKDALRPAQEGGKG